MARHLLYDLEGNMKLLLHMCCAPCSVYPLSVLREEKLDVEGLFYNPNIHPVEEFERRKQNVEKFSHINDLSVIYIDDFKQDTWEKFDGPDDQRCTMCYSIRLEKAAAYAKEKGYDAFTTSLLVSPYQKHELIKELGEKFAKKYGVKFYYCDFRPGFRQGQQKAKEMGLYRQKFCGCIISYNESPFKNKV
jgi:predicted adenine nucleotide alpha hydrolase (AANH) superfamily ATPase